MKFRRSTFSVLFAAILLACEAGAMRVDACGICGGVPGTLGAIHPKSIAVALAIRREIESGYLDVIKPTGAAQISGPMLGLKFRKLVSHSQDGARDLELIVIDTGARFRIDLANPMSGFVPVPAGKDKSPEPSVRWVVGKDVLHALLARKLTVDEAVKREILWIGPRLTIADSSD